MKTTFENNKFYFEGDMKNQLQKRKDIEFIGNVFSKQLVETEMNYTNNSISKTENFKFYPHRGARARSGCNTRLQP